MKLNEVRKLTLAALFLALALVLPFVTGQIPELGSRFLPMHLPVLLCGFICGPKYGGLIGLISPLLRTLLFTMPPLYPTAISMSMELVAYGLVTGIVYNLFRRKNLLSIYASLVLAMFAGRVILGVANVILLGLDEAQYTWQMFIAGAFVDAIPGIILQLIAIPAIIYALIKIHGSEARTKDNTDVDIPS